MTGGLNNDEQVGFREGMGCINQIFTLKQIGEKAQEEKNGDLEKAYDRVNREALRMCDVGG